MPIGPVMLDLEGYEINAREKDLLQNPYVGGLIYFSRNYASPNQVADLSQAIRETAGRDILIAVDHEGGRVQRFREGFSVIPPMGALLGEAKSNSESLEQAQQQAYQCGAMIALEVQAVGIDFSFAPVLDLNRQISQVIGDRAFSGVVDEVVSLGRQFIKGMNDFGMATTAKHFPGHGSIAADSHIAIPVDERSKQEIFTQDMQVFTELAQEYQAVMPAHVIYPYVDDKPAGFSSIWLKEILRSKLGFDGVIFSDDLSMKGAEVVGGYQARSDSALQAGCDMVLVCNHPKEGQQLVESARFDIDPASTARLQKMKGRALEYNLAKVQQSDNWLQLNQGLVA